MKRLEPHALVQPAAPHVSGHSHDGDPGIARSGTAKDEPLAGWILVQPIPMGERLIDDRYSRHGGERPLGIPTIRDRVVQTAAKLVLEPIFEADLEPNAYGYRPKRGAQEAVKKVHELLCDGYTDVVDADLSKYFDTIPHAELMQCVARRIVDSRVLHLIKMWLTVAVAERDDDDQGNWRYTGSQGKGTPPQGGVLTPRTQKITWVRP